MMRPLALLAVLSLSACGPVLGIPCETRDTCGASMSCFTGAPGGFCSHGCGVEGVSTDCPDGTVCTWFGKSSLVCSHACKTDADCRVNYECSPVLNSGGAMACRPAGLTR